MTTAQEEFDELMRTKGRRTNHPDDDSDHGERHRSDHSDDSDRTSPPLEKHPRPSMSLSRANIPRTRYAANTGPKGVIADAQAYRDSQRLHRQSRPVNRTSMNTTPTMGAQSNGISSGDRTMLRLAEDHEKEEEDSDEDIDLDEEDDEDFMLAWRQSRLHELQSGMQDIKARSYDRFRVTWSGMSTVDGNGYLHAIERSPPETAVLVYIYDDQSDVSADIEACLRDLAPLHPSVRFVRLHYHAAEMEPAGVPALLAYRGGEMFAGLVPVVDEIPDDAELSAETLETVLRNYQIL